MKKQAVFLGIGLLLMTATVVRSAEMRRFQPIRTPVKVASLTPQGFTEVPEIHPVDPAKVTKAMTRFFEDWNGIGTADLLAEDFFDKSRLGDAMVDATRVPPDARLRLLSLQGVHTIRQMIGEDPSHGQVLVSIVQVKARTQLEFNDSTHGFMRLEGVNDFIVEVTESLE